jgi:hypothetical protein
MSSLPLDGAHRIAVRRFALLQVVVGPGFGTNSELLLPLVKGTDHFLPVELERQRHGLAFAHRDLAFDGLQMGMPPFFVLA